MIELRPNEHGYDESHYLTLTGVGEAGEGQRLKLSLGESIVCGRSRHCDWSLKRTPRYLMSRDGERKKLKSDNGWNTVSRRHCRISFVAPDMVDVENLSPNGTFVDGHSVDRLIVTDCRTQTHQIQLGPHGVILELQPGSLPLETP